MIRVAHPGSGFFTYPGSRGQEDTGSRISNTAHLSVKLSYREIAHGISGKMPHLSGNFPNGGDGGALVVGTLPPEVHKDVVHHSLLQGCHVAVRKKSMVKFTEVFSPSSAADYNGGSGMFIPDPGSTSKNLSIFNLGNMIRDVHPGSGS